MVSRFTFHVSRFGWLAPVAVAFLLGLPHLSREQLWFDEVLSYTIYRHSPNLAEMTQYLATHENHPPLYYYLMFAWVRWVGDSPAAVRLFSVAANAAAAGLLWGLSRKWFGPTIAIVTALAYAFSPISVEFSREARPYALIAVLAVASWWALSAWLQRPQARRSLWLFAVLTIFGLYTHYAYVFLFGSQLAAIALTVWRGRQRPEFPQRRFDLLVVLLGLTIGYAPWLTVMANTLAAQYIAVEGLDPLSQVVTPVSFLALDVVFNALFFPAKFPLDPLGRILHVMIVGVLLTGVVVALRQLRMAAAAARRPWRELGWLAWWLWLPPTLFFLSPFSGRYSWYYHRHLITVVPAVALAAAFGLTGLQQLLSGVFRRAPVAAAGLAAIFAFNLPQYFTNDSAWDPQHQFADVAAYIAAHDSGGRELIIGFWPNYRIILDYYYRGPQTVGSLVPTQLFSNQLEISRGSPRLTPMEGYILTHPQATYRRYRLPDELDDFDVIWVVSVTQSLFDLDVALAADGWTPSYVELPRPLNATVYRFERRTP